VADTWDSLSLDSLLPTVGGKTIASLASDAATVASSLSSVLSTLSSLATTLAALVIDAADPFAAIVATLIADIRTFVDDFRTTGVSILIQNPKVRTVQTFVDDLSESFFDQSDALRPVFGAGATVGGVIVLAGSATPASFQALVDSLGQIFEIEQFKKEKRIADAPPPTSLTGTITAVGAGTVTDSSQAMGVDQFLGQVMEMKSGAESGNKFVITTNTATVFTLLEGVGSIAIGDTYVLRVGTLSGPPDWRATDISRILRAMTPAFNSLNAYSKAIAPAVKASAAASAFAALLSAKATRLSTLATDLGTLSTTLTALFSGSGFEILRLPAAVGGVDNFITRVKAAGSQPSFGATGKTAGVVMFVDSAAAYTILDLIF